jgi:hypothetical protein
MSRNPSLPLSLHSHTHAGVRTQPQAARPPAAHASHLTSHLHLSALSVSQPVSRHRPPATGHRHRPLRPGVWYSWDSARSAPASGTLVAPAVHRKTGCPGPCRRRARLVAPAVQRSSEQRGSDAASLASGWLPCVGQQALQLQAASPPVPSAHAAVLHAMWCCAVQQQQPMPNSPSLQLQDVLLSKRPRLAVLFCSLLSPRLQVHVQLSKTLRDLCCFVLLN